MATMHRYVLRMKAPGGEWQQISRVEVRGLINFAKDFLKKSKYEWAIIDTKDRRIPDAFGNKVWASRFIDCSENYLPF